jgi:hypothetical protein
MTRAELQAIERANEQRPTMGFTHASQEQVRALIAEVRRLQVELQRALDDHEEAINDDHLP